MGMRITWPIVGSRFQNNAGDWFTVVEVNGTLNIKIRFDEDGFEKVVSKGNILTGSIRLPKFKVGQVFKDKNGECVELIELEKSIGTFRWNDGYCRKCQLSVTYLNTLMREEDSMRLNYSIKEGDVFKLNCGTSCTVLEVINSKNIKIRIEEPVQYEDIVASGNLKKGSIRNKFIPKVVGLGYVGLSNISSDNIEYKSWAWMMRRCYDNRASAYLDCYVDDKWHDLTNFAEWFKLQKYQDKWQLDKDLLVKNNKCYSEKYCIYLPKEINTFLTNRANCRGQWPIGVTFHPRLNKWEAACSTNSGKSGYIGIYSSPEEAFYAYKDVKESYAKQLAIKWKGIIDDRAVVALQNYTVNIDD